MLYLMVFKYVNLFQLTLQKGNKAKLTNKAATEAGSFFLLQSRQAGGTQWTHPSKVSPLISHS